MRKCFITHGEKIFNVLVVVGFLAGLASGIVSGVEMGGRDGIISAALQVVVSWSGTFIVSLVVYSLLEIAHNKCNCACCNDKSKCETNDSACCK